MFEIDGYEIEVGRAYAENPTIPILADILKRRGKKDLYEKVLHKGKIHYIPYSNKQDMRELVSVNMDNVYEASADKLTTPGNRLLRYVMREMKVRATSIILNRDAFIKMYNYTPSSFYKAVKELLDGEFLYLSDIKDKYWINTTRITKGTPIESYKEFEVNRNKEKMLGI